MHNYFEEFMAVHSLQSHREIQILKDCIKDLEARIALTEGDLDEQSYKIRVLQTELDAVRNYT